MFFAIEFPVMLRRMKVQQIFEAGLLNGSMQPVWLLISASAAFGKIFGMKVPAGIYNATTTVLASSQV
jgi:hypothetical protein